MLVKICLTVSLLFGYFCQVHLLPSILNPVVNNDTIGSCPSSQSEKNIKEAARVREEIRLTLRDEVNPVLTNDYGPPCTCGEPGQWTKIAYINMSNPNEQCPSGWTRTYTTPVRGCGHLTSGCSSATFSAAALGRPYNQVCGQVYAYQKGSPDAFSNAIGGTPIDQAYVEGVSVTHGAPGSREHIWSFVAALYETAASSNAYHPQARCPCNYNNMAWPYTIPSYVGQDYFCDTGVYGPTLIADHLYTDNLMWDGEQCGPTSTCCQRNNPPWFCTTLPQATTDNIELRICGSDNREDTVVKLVEIYVQ